MRKFLCPKCKQIKDNLYQRISVVETWKVIPHSHNYDDVDYEERVEQETDDIEEVSCECGFSTTEWHSADFLVKINKTKIIPIGAYWHYFKSDFEKIVREFSTDNYQD